MLEMSVDSMDFSKFDSRDLHQGEEVKYSVALVGGSPTMKVYLAEFCSLLHYFSN